MVVTSIRMHEDLMEKLSVIAIRQHQERNWIINEAIRKYIEQEERQQKMSAGGEKDPYQQLTDREKEVLKLIAEGHTGRDIADILIVSPKTVEWYKTSLMNKLNLHIMPRTSNKM